MKKIFGLNYFEIKEALIAAGLKEYVADQFYTWIFKKRKYEPEAWLNISKKNRALILSLFDLSLEKIVKTSGDKNETRKILLELNDGMRIESVLIKEKNHYTFCISSQVGCALGCKFCATGKIGFKKNLDPGEIISQILILKGVLSNFNGKVNLVFMGMGEPLLNYKNLKKALLIITDPNGIGISQRKITVSTAGILENIKRIEEDFPRIKISFSLNASDKNLREQLMPISRKEKLTEILRYFREKRRKQRVTFEYVLIDGINDSQEDSKNLASLIRGIPCKINVIPYNENKMIPFRTPPEERVNEFAESLAGKGFTVMVRWSKGRDIKSACGQLVGE